MAAEKKKGRNHTQQRKGKRSYLLVINQCLRRSAGLPRIGKLRVFFPGCLWFRLLLQNGRCLNLYRAAKSHSLSLLSELLNANKSRKLAFLKIALLPSWDNYSPGELKTLSIYEALWSPWGMIYLTITTPLACLSWLNIKYVSVSPPPDS